MKFKILFALVLAAIAVQVYGGGLPQWVTGSVPVATNLTVANFATNNFTGGTSYPVPQGVPMTLTLVTVDGASATGTSNSWVGIDWSADNINFTTSQPLKMTNTANTATNVVSTLTTNLSGIAQSIKVTQHGGASNTTNTIVNLNESHYQ